MGVTVLPVAPSTRSGRLAAVLLGVAALLTPGVANAQRQPFTNHLVTFRTLLFGPYGDEGERVLEELDLMAGALAAWNDAVRVQEKTPSAGNGSVLALALADAGRFAEALAAVDAALEAAPGRPQLQTLRGSLLAILGRESDAAAAYLRAWELDRSDVANAYLAFSTPAAPDARDSGPLGTLMAAQRRRAGRAEPSTDLFREVRLIPDRASKTPVFAPAAYVDGFEALAAGNYVQALARFRAAAARDPLLIDRASRSVTMSAGVARLRAGMFAEAIAPLEAAASTHGDSSEVHRILGTAYGAVGDDARSVEHLRRAVRLAPRDERSRLALARVLRDGGRLDDAVRSLRETLEALPRSGEARWMLGDALEKTGLGVDAARDLEAAGAATVIAGKSALLLRAAEIYDRHQQFDRLVELLRSRVRLDPNEAVVRRQLGLVLNRLGRSNEAFAELAIADLLGGADAEALSAIGQIHLEAGRVADAELSSRRAIALQPDHREARYVLARALLRQGRGVEAREELDAVQRLRARAMEDQRRGFEIDTLRAEAARATAAGRHAEAAAVWGRLTERMPLVPEFQVAAAEALAAGGELEEALSHLETAARLGAAPDVQRRLAEIYARLGRLEQSARARRIYEEQVKALLKVSPPTPR